MKITVLALLALTMMACSKGENSSAPAAKAAQKGLEGREIVGYLKDPKDDGVCVVLTAKSKEEAATMTKDKVAEVAKMIKGEVTDSCKTDGVVGTCLAMGMLQNYYGPKYAKDTAKAACDKDHGTWFE